MRKKLSVVVVLVVALALVAAAPVGAKEPLRGDVVVDFNVGVVTGEGAVPQYAWVGTVDLYGEPYLMDEPYLLVFYDGPMIPTGKVFHWTEDWEIFEPGTYEIVDGIVTSFEPGALVLAGTVDGIMNPQAGGPSHGRVTGAYGDFAEWDGRSVHIPGGVTEWIVDGPYADWGLPKVAEMTLRIN